MQQVQVQFMWNGEYGGQKYSYHVDHDLEVKVTDLVIVFANGEYKVVMVVGTEPSDKATAWVVDKLNIEKWKFNQLFR